jgi:hypothetical protein
MALPRAFEGLSEALIAELPGGPPFSAEYIWNCLSPPKPGVPRSLRFLQGAGADSAQPAGFLNRIFMTSVSFTRTFPVCPYK